MCASSGEKADFLRPVVFYFHLWKLFNDRTLFAFQTWGEILEGAAVGREASKAGEASVWDDQHLVLLLLGLEANN